MKQVCIKQDTEMSKFFSQSDHKNKYDHISPALNRLEWPKMEAGRFQHRVLLVRKCVRKEVPPYLQEMFIKNNQIHCYETRQNSILHMNRVKINFGLRTFSYRSVNFIICCQLM